MVDMKLFALVYAVEKFKIFIMHGTHSLIVQSDHNSLKYSAKFKEKNHWLLKWSLSLQPFNIIVRHIKGRENIVADALSRAV